MPLYLCASQNYKVYTHICISFSLCLSQSIMAGFFEVGFLFIFQGGFLWACVVLLWIGCSKWVLHLTFKVLRSTNNLISPAAEFQIHKPLTNKVLVLVFCTCDSLCDSGCTAAAGCHYHPGKGRPLGNLTQIPKELLKMRTKSLNLIKYCLGIWAARAVAWQCLSCLRCWADELKCSEPIAAFSSLVVSNLGSDNCNPPAQWSHRHRSQQLNLNPERRHISPPLFWEQSRLHQRIRGKGRIN